MKAELIDYMGSDLTCVNAARVSFDKESEWGWENGGEDEHGAYEEKALHPADQKLIRYLAKHNHFTPFTHVMITMRETVPIFVARQRFKHMVGFTYNEVSRRYVDDAPEFFYPDVWRGKPINAKQGSSDKEIVEFTYDGGTFLVSEEYKWIIKKCEEFYNLAIEQGIAPEQARMVLPQSMYTSYYTTGSLAAWARAYRLRSDAHAQREIQDLAAQWNDIISNIPELKYSWNALTQST